VRQFIKGTDGDFIRAFASALMGSAELYGKSETHEGDWWGQNGGAKWRGGRTPMHTINFVTAHDGFTLNDLVSYNDKHNEANGEDNMDGALLCHCSGSCHVEHFCTCQGELGNNHSFARTVYQGCEPKVVPGWKLALCLSAAECATTTPVPAHALRETSSE
jgi:hypothetical protein